MKKRYAIILAMFIFFVAGCSDVEEGTAILDSTEPSLTYTWMAGDSPVTAHRMGVTRAGVNNADHTISPSGVYYMCATGSDAETGDMVTYLLYSDYGSDTVIKLCGRADCNHENVDCNSYFENGCNISYYNGYLYATNSYGSKCECILYRLDTDGNNRVELYDFSQFAVEKNLDFAVCDMIDNGMCYVTLYRWIEMEYDDGSKGLQGEAVDTYLYKVDGTMEVPVLMESKCGPLYHCGEVFLALMSGTQNGGFNGYDFSYWDYDPETDTITYLSDHPGIAGFYGKEYGYYFRDGAVIRLNYETRDEERIIETDLSGSYYAKCFPDCIVIASKESGANADKRLYIYNWGYELVDIVSLSFLPEGLSAHRALIIETAERLILTSDSFSNIPKYYIEKSELGSGDVKVHIFNLPDFQ